MSIVCGNTAIIDGVNTMARWELRDSADSGPWSASNVPKGTGRGETNRRVMARYSAYGHTPAYFPGDTLTFTGNVDGSNGVSFDAVCKTVRIIANRESDKPYIYHVVDLVNSGSTVTYGSASATDVTTPDIMTALDSKLAFYDQGAWGDENATYYIELELTTETRESAHSDSGGFWVNVAGCRVDAKIKYALYEGTPTNLHQPNVSLPCRFYVEDSTGDGTPDLFWEIEAMRFRAINGWTADHEGRKPVGGLIVAEWNAAGDGTGIGHIIDPATTTKWP